MGMLAGDGRVCRTRDVRLVQAVRREGLDLEGVSIRAHGLQESRTRRMVPDHVSGDGSGS